MRQDTDVARMAAALRTPSLKYRSFGNEPVLNLPASPKEECQLLGDALAGMSDLPPDATLGFRRSDSAPLPANPPPAAKPAMLAPADFPQAQAPPTYDPSIRATPVQAQPAFEAPRHDPPAYMPVQPQPDHVPFAYASPAAIHPRVVPAMVGSRVQTPDVAAPPAPGLLQMLLGGAAATGTERRYVPQAPPHVPMQAAPQGSPPPQAPGRGPAAPSPYAMPARSRPTEPILPSAPPPVPPVFPTHSTAQDLVPSLLSPLSQESLSQIVARGGGALGTGSSLLDTLVGPAPGEAAPANYPLLDALGDAMRGNSTEPPSRHWPAARVDIALPELLRRVAAGVRSARSAT
jgi:hypothetical protein